MSLTDRPSTVTAQETVPTESSRGKLSRDAILTEAAALFKRRGYQRTRLEDVARLLGVTRAAFYYHFKDKQSILAAIQMRAIEGLMAQAQAVDVDGLTAHEAFWQRIQAHIEYVARNAVEVGVVFEEEEELTGSVANEVRRMRREYNQRLVDLYEAASAAGDAAEADAKLAVNTILGAATWVYRWYRPDMGSPPVVAREMVQLLRSGAGRRGAAQ
jgi:AcrR family transcriptional regulator